MPIVHSFLTEIFPLWFS